MADRLDLSSEQKSLTMQQAIDLAVQHHTSGDLLKAENIYQQILQADPNQPVALHLLGVIAHQVGDNDRAVDLITKTLIIKPDFAEAHNSLGAALKELGHLDEAFESYHKALSIKPNYAEAHSNLSVALQSLGKLEEAVECCHKALAILTEWVDFTADVERELGLPPFKRQELNTDTLLQRGHLEFKTYRLQRGIILTFSKDHTFANTRVGNDYDLQTREETVFCPHPFEDVGILWNGDVTLCCMDYDAQLKVGNVLDTSIETVLQSKAAQDLRSSMLGHRPLASVCQTCQSRPVRRENLTTDAISQKIY